MLFDSEFVHRLPRERPQHCTQKKSYKHDWNWYQNATVLVRGSITSVEPTREILDFDEESKANLECDRKREPARGYATSVKPMLPAMVLLEP